MGGAEVTDIIPGLIKTDGDKHRVWHIYYRESDSGIGRITYTRCRAVVDIPYTVRNIHVDEATGFPPPYRLCLGCTRAMTKTIEDLLDEQSIIEWAHDRWAGNSL